MTTEIFEFTTSFIIEVRNAVMRGLDPRIHVLSHVPKKRGWPGQARP
jgi:hypothetical protein